MISGTLILVVIIILVALIFDYINGFHDAANSVATIVATRVLTPFQAVLWAAFWNFIAAVPALIGEHGISVAKTVGSGMVAQQYVSEYVILSGLMGAIVWDLITWWFGLPTSSSHALIGGYAGAAMAKAALIDGPGSIFMAILPAGWTKTLIFIVLAPMIGMALAYILMIIVYWLFRRSTPKYMDFWFRRLQLVSAALFSYSHGANDAQKTMGIMTSVLLAAGYLSEFKVQPWVIFSAHLAIALGTMTGGWRIVHTMAPASLASSLAVVLRRNCRGNGDSVSDVSRYSRLHDSRHHRCDCRCRLHSASQSGPLETGSEYCLGLGFDSPRLRPRCRTLLLCRTFHFRRHVS